MKLVCAFLIILFIVLSGCSGQAPETSPEPQPTSPSESEPTPLQTPDNDTSEEPDTSSQVILKYWEAMNSYNLGRALSYYEEQYREQEEEEVAGDIGNLKQFSVTLSVLEVSEPVYMSEDKVKHNIILETPIDERGLTYLLERIDGEWKIYLEDNTEDFTEFKEFIIDFLTKYGESQRMDIMINAEQQIGMQRATTEYGLAELAESGEIIEPRPGIYSLPGE
jgi:hypothetical protein